MKARKKKFDDGGEVDIRSLSGADRDAAERKRLGYSAESAPRRRGADVGFLKRLLMGNVDQPGSEANTRFGAGRNAATGIRGLEGAERVAAEAKRQGYSAEPTPRPAGEDVGFFKRLLMGNVDQPGSEANKRFRAEPEMTPYKKGGKVKSYAKGGSVSSASKRADGIAQRGKTRGRVL